MHSLGGTWGYDPGTRAAPSWQHPVGDAGAVADGQVRPRPTRWPRAASPTTTTPRPRWGSTRRADGMPVPTSGVTGTARSRTPAWSPDGSQGRLRRLGRSHRLERRWLQLAEPAARRPRRHPVRRDEEPDVLGPQTLVPVGTEREPITWPTVSPDGQWIMYARAGGLRHAQRQRRPLPGERRDAEPGGAPGEGSTATVTPSRPARATSRGTTSRASRRSRRAGTSGPSSRAAAPTATRSGQAEPCGNATGRRLRTRVPPTAQRTPPGSSSRHRPEPEARASTRATRRSTSRGRTRRTSRCAASWSLAAVRAGRAGLHLGHRLLRRLLREPAGTAGRRPAGRMPSGCSQNGDKCNDEQRLLQRGARASTCIEHVCSEPTPQ